MNQDDQLNEVRTKIDVIDDRINDLLTERAACAAEVKKVKGDAAVYRPKREAEILERVTKQHSGLLPEESVRAVFTEIVASCRNLEQMLKVAYLGPAGSYSYSMARLQHGTTSEFLSCQTLKEVVVAVEQGKADVGILPIENSSEGPVVESQKLIQQTDLRVTLEATLPIEHCLLGSGPLQDIRTVYAHPQALGQCRIWIQSNLPKAHIVSATSNSEAAKLAATHKNAVAIASKEAAELYELGVLAETINDEAGNRTRFLTLSKMAAEATGNDRTTAIITLKDKYGSLYSLLGEFVKYKIDLTNLKSQPASGGLHTFFIEFVGHVDDENVSKALQEIKAHSTQCKIIGSYPREV